MLSWFAQQNANAQRDSPDTSNNMNMGEVAPWVSSNHESCQWSPIIHGPVWTTLCCGGGRTEFPHALLAVGGTAQVGVTCCMLFIHHFTVVRPKKAGDGYCHVVGCALKQAHALQHGESVRIVGSDE